MRKKLYFAHQITMYNTPAELEILADIRRAFPGHDIVNPSEGKHQDAVRKLKEQGSKNVMADYFLPLVKDPEMDRVVFTAFSNGKIGKGAYDETQAILDNGGRAFFYDPNTRGMVEVTSLKAFTAMDVPETRAALKEEWAHEKQHGSVYSSRARYARKLTLSGFENPVKISRAANAKRLPGTPRIRF